MYAKKEGFSLKRCTPEHPVRNVIAERFMIIIVKVVRAVIAEGKDPKMNLWKEKRRCPPSRKRLQSKANYKKN